MAMKKIISRATKLINDQHWALALKTGSLGVEVHQHGDNAQERQKKQKSGRLQTTPFLYRASLESTLYLGIFELQSQH